MLRPPTLVTAEQLLEMPGDQRVELVRGELVEMVPVNVTHSWLVTRLGAWMEASVRPRNLGMVGCECGFILRRDPDTVRGPDLCYVREPRLDEADDYGFFPGAPDIAVEVLSPGERHGEVETKVREYLDAGTRLVWVADPPRRTVTAHRPGAKPQVYSGDDVVTGEDVLPGFSFKVAELFAR